MTTVATYLCGGCCRPIAECQPNPCVMRQSRAEEVHAALLRAFELAGTKPTDPQYRHKEKS